MDAVSVACIWLPEIGLTVERTRRPTLTDLILSAGGVVQVVSPDLTKRSGIRPGMQVSGAKAVCPGLAVLPYDRGLYEEGASHIWEVIAVESSTVEPISPELVYLALDGTDRVERLTELVEELKAVLDTPIHTGLARTKILAFTAAKTSTDGGVAAVLPDDEASLLAPVSLSALNHLKAPAQKRLARLGVSTLGDVQKLPRAELIRQLNTEGLKVYELAFGNDFDAVRPSWPPPSITETWNFDAFEDFADYVDRRTLHNALCCMSHSIAEQLKVRRRYCERLRLAVAVSRAETLVDEERLKGSSDDPQELFRAALRLLERLKLTSVPQQFVLEALGVGIGSGVQLTLINDQGLDGTRERLLEARIAELRQKFGLAAVVKGIEEPPSKISLYTHALAHRRAENVEVIMGTDGLPAKVTRCATSGRVYDVDISKLYDWWEQSQIFWGEPYSWMVYRIELEPGSLFDLHHVGYDRGIDSWQLGAVDD